MRGSFSIWCTSSDVEVSDHGPLVELHFNIWCGLPGDIPDVLDIGILFKEPRPITELFLYIPGPVNRTQLQDLSGLLRDPITLSAVFNDILEVGNERPGSFDVLRGSVLSFRIVSVNLDDPDEATIELLNETDGQRGTTIKIGTKVISQMSGVGDHYIRFRLALSGGLSDMLVSRIEPDDRLFLSSFYQTQMIEFRLNEKRNFSKELREISKDRPPASNFCCTLLLGTRSKCGNGAVACNFSEDAPVRTQTLGQLSIRARQSEARGHDYLSLERNCRDWQDGRGFYCLSFVPPGG